MKTSNQSPRSDAGRSASAPTNVTAASSSDDVAHISHEEIREKAYLLWQDAGSPNGRSDEYWFAAETELRKQRGGAGDREEGDERPDDDGNSPLRSGNRQGSKVKM